MATVSASRAAQNKWRIASRIFAAIFGGYILTTLLTIAFALLLTASGMNKSEAVLATTMASFLMFAVIVMAVFYARTPTRAWLGLAIASLPPAVFAAIYEETIPWASLLMP